MPEEKDESADSARSRPVSFRVSVEFAFAALSAYLLIYYLLYPMIGAGVAALAILPVVVTGWLWGTRAGLAAGLLCFPLNTILLNQAGYQPGGWDVVLRGGGGPGTVALVFIGGVVGRLRDLSEALRRELSRRRQAEAVLQKSEERYRRIIEAAAEGIWVIDAESTTTFVNAHLAEMLGYTTAEMLGMSLFDFMDADGKATTTLNLERRRQGIAEQYDFKFRRKDGTDLWVILSATPFLDRNGQYAGFLAMVTDITERLQAERALQHAHASLRASIKELEQRTRALAALSPIPTPDGGTDDEPPDDRGEVTRLARSINQMADALEQRGAEQAHLLAQVQAGRERLQFLSRQLLRAQEVERRHIARELHDEIGQVLTSVKLSLQSVELLPGYGWLAPYLADSMAIVDRALQQVRDLSLELRPSLLDDFGLAAALEWYVGRQAQRSGLDLQLEVDPGLSPRLPAEIETACYRIVQEALTNVVRHAQARQVHIALAQRENELSLLIRDDGVGFDVAAAHARAASGASLGLLGMEERATLAGGQLEIASAPTQGSEIWAHFPLSAPYLQRRRERRDEP
jgi:PAS domain S-box-containing protein